MSPELKETTSVRTGGRAAMQFDTVGQDDIRTIGIEYRSIIRYVKSSTINSFMAISK